MKRTTFPFSAHFLYTGREGGVVVGRKSWTERKHGLSFRALQQEDAGQDVPSIARVHVSQSPEGRKSSEVGDHAMDGEVEDDDGGTWRRREDPRPVANASVDGGMSQGSELDDVGSK